MASSRLELVLVHGADEGRPDHTTRLGIQWSCAGCGNNPSPHPIESGEEERGGRTGGFSRAVPHCIHAAPPQAVGLSSARRARKKAG